MSYADRTSLRERPGRPSIVPDDVAPLASDIPEGMTIAAYRRSRSQPERTWPIRRWGRASAR
jgi:hypothetical protein